MNQLNSVDHLSQLTADEKKKHKPLITNCYLFPNQIEELTDKGRLTYEIHDDGLILLCDMGYYYNLYYYIKPDKGISFPKREKPVVVEFHDSELRHNKQNDIMIPYWEEVGFKHNATVHRMVCEYTQESLDELLDAHETEYEVITAKEPHFDRIFELLFEAFDPIENLFESKEDLRKSMEDGDFLCIVDDNDQVMCALQTPIKNGEVNMHHVVVDKKHRGKNLSWHLRKSATKKAWDQGIKKRVGWVVEGNEPGIISAKKVGLEFDGRYTVQYILK